MGFQSPKGKRIAPLFISEFGRSAFSRLWRFKYLSVDHHSFDLSTQKLVSMIPHLDSIVIDGAPRRRLSSNVNRQSRIIWDSVSPTMLPKGCSKSISSLLPAMIRTVPAGGEKRRRCVNSYSLKNPHDHIHLLRFCYSRSLKCIRWVRCFLKQPC